MYVFFCISGVRLSLLSNCLMQFKRDHTHVACAFLLHDHGKQSDVIRRN